MVSAVTDSGRAIEEVLEGYPGSAPIYDFEAQAELEQLEEKSKKAKERAKNDAARIKEIRRNQ